MAGFEVTFYGRIWVTPEGEAEKANKKRRIFTPKFSGYKRRFGVFSVISATGAAKIFFQSGKYPSLGGVFEHHNGSFQALQLGLTCQMHGHASSFVFRRITAH